MLKRLPIGIQTFRDIVQNDYLYVDKTKEIFDLVNNPKGVYFLSRPRRFGKSLLIFTLNEIFDGNKDHALNQIKDKKYFEKYQGAGKEIYLLGVEFADRNVGEWVVEKTP